MASFSFVGPTTGNFPGVLNQIGLWVWGIYNTDFSEAIMFLMSRQSGENLISVSTKIFERGSLNINTNVIGTVVVNNPKSEATYMFFSARLSKV